MNKIQVIPYKPLAYLNTNKSFDGIYSSCRFHKEGEFVTKFPIFLNIKADKSLISVMGEKEYVNQVIDTLNKPPPPPEYSGRGRRPKQPPPKYGKIELISFRIRKKEKLDILELKVYTNDAKNKSLYDFSSAKQLQIKPDGRKNRKKKNEV